MRWSGIIWFWSGWTTYTSIDFSYITPFSVICAEEKHCAAMHRFAEAFFFFGRTLMPLCHEKQSSSLLRGSAWQPWRAWSFVTSHVVESFWDLSHGRKELQWVLVIHWVLRTWQMQKSVLSKQKWACIWSPSSFLALLRTNMRSNTLCKVASNVFFSPHFWKKEAPWSISQKSWVCNRAMVFWTWTSSRTQSLPCCRCYLLNSWGQPASPAWEYPVCSATFLHCLGAIM